MDSQIFLGGSEPTTLKDLSEMLGKETIDAFNTSDTRGNSPSYGTTFQKMGHELLSRDELAVLDGGKCILQLRGVRPVSYTHLGLVVDFCMRVDSESIRDFMKKWNLDWENDSCENYLPLQETDLILTYSKQLPVLETTSLYSSVSKVS